MDNDKITGLSFTGDCKEYLLNNHLPNLIEITSDIISYVPSTVRKITTKHYICEEYVELTKLVIKGISDIDRMMGLNIPISNQPVKFNINPLMIEHLVYDPNVNSADLHLMVNLKFLKINCDSDSPVKYEYNLNPISENLIEYHGFNGLGNIPSSVKQLIFNVEFSCVIPIVEKLTLVFERNDRYINLSSGVKDLCVEFRTIMNDNIVLDFPNVKYLSVFFEKHNNYDYTVKFISQYNYLLGLNLSDYHYLPNNYHKKHYDFPNLTVDELWVNDKIEVIKTVDNEIYYTKDPNYQISPSSLVKNLIYHSRRMQEKLILDLPYLVNLNIKVLTHDLILNTPCLELLSLTAKIEMKLHPINLRELRITGNVNCEGVTCDKLTIENYSYDGIVVPDDYHELYVTGILKREWLHEGVHTLTVSYGCECGNIDAPFLKVLNCHKSSRDLFTVSENCEVIIPNSRVEISIK